MSRLPRVDLAPHHPAMIVILLLTVTSALVKLPAVTSAADSAIQPGALFREYRWTNTGGDAGGSLRVGGRLDYGGEPIELAGQLDLIHATGAEVVVEKLLCHDGTHGLAISFNDHEWITFPEAEGIPAPQWEYQHHTYPVVSVPLDHLHSSAPNRFRLQVDEEHSWDWPQNLVYGVHLRVFYDANLKPHPTGKLVSPHPNDELGLEVPLQVEASSPNGPITRVDYLGYFEGVNLEGDGRFTQWHYHYVQAALAGHIGSSTSRPFGLTWDNSWVPDQPQPFKLAAWITDQSGLTLFTDSIDGLTFARNLSVELCKPNAVPKKWVTRSGEREQKFQVRGNLAHATRAMLVFCSWSPGYLAGVYVNDHKVLDREGPRYAYYVHRILIDDLSFLRAGENTVKTGKTPKYDGKMVHGTEINWPGIMVLIQYRN